MPKTISTQRQLDSLVKKGIKKGEEFVIESKTTLDLKAELRVYGYLAIKTKVSMGYLWQSNKVVASDSATVEASDSATVRASGSATVRAWGSATVEASGSATVRASDSATVRAWGSATVRAWGSATVRASGSATVRASDSATVRASGSATVRAWGSATVEASDSATVEASGSAKLSLLGFAVGIIFPSVKVVLKSEFSHVVERKQVFKTKKKTIGYKKLRDGLIATLEIPKGQIFQSEWNHKCRTSSAKVIKIEAADGTEQQEGVSQHDNSFTYKVGEVVSAKYDERIEECSTGIHFFLNREAAEKW